MLVLSRKLGEKILIGEVEVVVVKAEAGRVRLGIIAPKDIPVDRAEVRKQKTKAA